MERREKGEGKENWMKRREEGKSEIRKERERKRENPLARSGECTNQTK